MDKRPKVLPSLFLSLLLIFSLSACDQNNDDIPQMEAAPIIDENEIPLWLDGQVEMERTAELLITAADRFDESHRMIANRAAQLEDMLFEHNIKETAVNRLEWFTKLPTLQTPHSFSALCQYYYNLRTKGKTEDEIIQNLLRL